MHQIYKMLMVLILRIQELQILESDIGWYHNVMNLLRNWYLIQTAAVNEMSRSVKFKDEVMGELIRLFQHTRLVIPLDCHIIWVQVMPIQSIAFDLQISLQIMGYLPLWIMLDSIMLLNLRIA